MEEQEKVICITVKEKENIMQILEAYKTTLEKGYKQVKRKAPFQTVILSQLVAEIQKIGKLIIELKNK